MLPDVKKYVYNITFYIFIFIFIFIFTFVYISTTHNSIPNHFHNSSTHRER